MQAEDDRLDFLDEEFEESGPGSHSREPWKILIVDDDDDVHQATVFALHDARILGRQLNFLHAYNSASALELLRETPDVAVILLDVVMETEDAGLVIIGQIREELCLKATRIILRTGQPGYAPDIEAITRFDINDYKTKAELNRSRLFTALTAAIRSYDQITRLDASRHGLEVILQGSSRFIAEQGMVAFASRVLEQTALLLGLEPVGVIGYCRPEETGERLVMLAAAGRYQAMLEGREEGIDVERVRNCLGEAFREKRLLLGERDLAVYFSASNGAGFVAYLETPSLVHEVDEHLLGVFCANMAICADNIDLVERLRETAYVDSLTCLPNRAAMIEAMEQRLTMRDGELLAAAVVDIDQFSETIDILGYRYGDQMLLEMANRLRGSLPADVYVARVGGDIFGIFGNEDVVNPALLREILADPLIIEGGAQAVSISLGFVRVGNDMTSGADLLRYAAIALKRAKSGGVGCEAYYTPEVAVETRERVRMLQDLRLAFDKSHLFVVYQPQVDLLTGRPIGAEALMRWRTEDNKLVPPDRFIPVAEQSGLIVNLGAWILRVALGTLKRLENAGCPVRMAVNVSAIQFRHPAFIDMVDEALADTGVSPGNLELEITESVAMFGQGEFEGRLQALKSRGVAVAIDDFGTGFSSLSYLDRLAADRLKIDRSFVNVLDSGHQLRIAEMITGLGKRLGMKVLAEGVETEQQAELLRKMGCDEAQGWLYGKPVSEEELLAVITQRAA